MQLFWLIGSSVWSQALSATAVLAQSAGAGGSDTGGGPSSLSQMAFRAFTWVQDQQQWFSQNMTGAIEKLSGGNALQAGLLLATFSFVYGVLHAVGPGHGKAVISSYVLANERTLRRGVLLSFMAGLFQAISAVVLVSIFALVFNMGSRRMTAISNNLETISYAVITLFGLWLLFVQLRGMWTAAPAMAIADDHGHAGHDHDAHDHDAHDHDGHDHDHGTQGHDATYDGHQDHSSDGHDGHDHAGHSHLPAAQELEGTWSWTKAVGLAAAVGLRPCTGALIVLVIALHQGLYWAGILSTFVMALGTSITVSILAVMAVTSRDFATRLAGGSELWVGRIETLAKLGGGTIMVVAGALFFVASLYPHPFQ